MLTHRARETKIDALFANDLPYTALEAGPPFDFQWSQADVRRVIQFWDTGLPAQQIAELLGRDPDEVAVLIIDLARREIISGRREKKGAGAA